MLHSWIAGIAVERYRTAQVGDVRDHDVCLSDQIVSRFTQQTAEVHHCRNKANDPAFHVNQWRVRPHRPQHESSLGVQSSASLHQFDWSGRCRRVQL